MFREGRVAVIDDGRILVRPVQAVSGVDVIGGVTGSSRVVSSAAVVISSTGIRSIDNPFGSTVSIAGSLGETIYLHWLL